MAGESTASGQDTIAAAFRAVYGGAADDDRAPAPGTTGVLAGVRAHRGEDHWHLVTRGLAELLPAAAGGGGPGPGGPLHELTLLTPPAARAPDWAFALLVGVARTLQQAGRPLHAGARLAPGEPLDGAGSGLVALGVRDDPLVVPAGPHVLLQLVGVTAGEYAVMQRVGTALVLARLAERDPLLRTDPTRA